MYTLMSLLLSFYCLFFVVSVPLHIFALALALFSGPRSPLELIPAFLPRGPFWGPDPRIRTSLLAFVFSCCLVPGPGLVSVLVFSARSPAPTINFPFFLLSFHFVSIFFFTLIDSPGIGQVGVVVGLTSVVVQVVVRGWLLVLLKVVWFGLARKAV